MIFTIIFILGAILGSFYNVVGYRVPKKESIVSPPSHCPKCNEKLGALELIPILSYIIQKGRCTHCKEKISPMYAIFEFLTGLLFGLAYLSFGLTPELIIALTFISMLIIIVVSDLHYMIISDGVLLFFGMLLSLEILIIFGLDIIGKSILSAGLAFLLMFGIKKLGDFMFKKESMGGGDIKLMAVFGLVIGFPMSILSIFLSSVIALPISLILIKKNPEHIIPFGPFLALAAVIILLLQIDLDTLIKIYGY